MPACATRTATVRARRLRPILSWTPPDAAPHSRPAAVDRLSAARGDYNWHRSRLCHVRLCHPGRGPDRVEGHQDLRPGTQYRRGGIMLPLEGNRWMVTLGGRHGDVPPGDAEGVPTYARSLRTPTIYNAIRHAKPLDGVARYGFPERVRRHVERLDVFPRGLLPIGDAICRGRSAVRVLIWSRITGPAGYSSAWLFRRSSGVAMPRRPHLFRGNS